MPMDQNDRITETEKAIAIVKEKFILFNMLYERIDKTLTKLETMVDDNSDDQDSKIRETHSKISESEARLLKEISEIKKKVDDLNKWRWFTIGISTALGWIISVVFGMPKH